MCLILGIAAGGGWFALRPDTSNRQTVQSEVQTQSLHPRSLGESGSVSAQGLTKLFSEYDQTSQNPQHSASIPLESSIPVLQETDSAGATDPSSATDPSGDPSSDPSPTASATDEATDPIATEKEMVISGEIKQGDTAEEILAPFVDPGSFQQILKVTKNTHSLARIREGQPYTVVRSPQDGHMDLFEYEIDRDRKLVINREETGFTANVEPIEYDTETVVVRGEITSSLFQAIASTGENPDLAIHLSNIFGSEINFIKDLRQGDSFALVLDKRYRDGEFRNYGTVHAAQFINQDKKYEGFRFTADTGAERYFNAKGESLVKTLLKAPLSFTRVTSGYSLSRKHPVYFDRRPHQGVDYGAPSGTPVKAVGDGTVSKSGWGNGFGNMVIIKHSGGLESMYSHLSGFAKNARAGAKVRQGQVIGYVGSTGVSTGPHLDFRLKQNGKYVNPTKFVAPRGNPVPAVSKTAFTQHVKKMQELM